MALGIKKPSVNLLTWLFALISIGAALGAGYQVNRINEMQAFNLAVSEGKTPETDKQSFEAKYAVAYWLARKERFKESTLLFSQLMEKADTEQKAALQYNLGNIFFLRGLAINGTNMTVRDETEYLLRQAATAYKTSLRLKPQQWDTKHNMDRVMTMLPATPTPGVGESDTPGLIMGNIPVGLP